MKKFLKEFKAFAMRGNVIDLAVGVIIGGAFTGIVTSLTENFIQPLLNFVFGTLDPAYTVGGAISAFLTAIVNFIITAFVLFCVIKGINKMSEIGKKPAAPAPKTTKECPFCKSEIPLYATRCKFCTSEIPEAK